MFHNWFLGGGMWFGWIFWIAIVALIIYLVVNQGNRNRQITWPPHHESALDILKKRYAKGEITKEQFDQMKKDLE